MGLKEDKFFSTDEVFVARIIQTKGANLTLAR